MAPLPEPVICYHLVIHFTSIFIYLPTHTAVTPTPTPAQRHPATAPGGRAITTRERSPHLRVVRRAPTRAVVVMNGGRREGRLFGRDDVES